MSRKKHRPRGTTVESTVYKNGELRTITRQQSGESTLAKPVNQLLEIEKLRLLSAAPLMTTKQLIVKLCQMRGPWSPFELHKQFIELRKPVGMHTIYAALRDLVAFGAVVKANGGYCIIGWDKQ